jgi:hypothetical protein
MFGIFYKILTGLLDVMTSSEKPTVPLPPPNRPPKPPSGKQPMSALTVALSAAVIIETITIGAIATGGAETGIAALGGRAYFETIIEIESELNRTFEIEIQRLKTRRPPRANRNASCKGAVNETLDQLDAQVRGRLRSVLESGIKHLALKGEGESDTNRNSNVNGTCFQPRSCHEFCRYNYRTIDYTNDDR